jgi:ATP-binding cassette subfamily B protein
VSFLRGFLAILVGSWRASPARMLAIFGLTLLSYASAPLTPLALKHITDAVVAHDAGTATHWAIALPLLALLTAIGAHLLHVLFVEVADQNVINLTDDVAGIAHGPTGLAHLENAKYADELELIRNEGAWRYMSVRAAVVSIGVVVQLTLTVLLLARLQPILLLLLAFAIPPLVGTRWSWQHFSKRWQASADKQRRAGHYSDLTLRADAAKEVRLFGLADEIAERLGAARGELRELFFRTEIAGVLAQAAGFLVFAAGYVGALLIVVRGAVRGAHTTGDVVLAVSLASQTNQLVFGVVTAMQRLQRASTAADRMRSMRRLLAELYPTRTGAALPAPERLERGIRVDDVTFRYPTTDAAVLEDVDLELPAGRPSHSSARTVRASRRSSSCCATSTSRRRAGSRSTASTSSRSTSPPGASESPPASRTSPSSSCWHTRAWRSATCRNSETWTRSSVRSTAARHVT